MTSFFNAPLLKHLSRITVNCRCNYVLSIMSYIKGWENVRVNVETIPIHAPHSRVCIIIVCKLQDITGSKKTGNFFDHLPCYGYPSPSDPLDWVIAHLGVSDSTHSVFECEIIYSKIWILKTFKKRKNVRFSNVDYSIIGPFHNQTGSDHLNTGHVWYSVPYCT